MFKQTGNLPSEPALYKTPAIANFKNPFFTNAPVGQIFTSSVKKLKPQITGPHQGDIQTAASNAIQRVEQKKQSPAAVVGTSSSRTSRTSRPDLLRERRARAGRIPQPAGPGPPSPEERRR